jgi:hypothetical protein
MDQIKWDLDWNIPRKSGFIGIQARGCGCSAFQAENAWTVKELKDYLKQNKIKGYSGKRKAELIKMCMSF